MERNAYETAALLSSTIKVVTTTVRELRSKGRHAKPPVAKFGDGGRHVNFLVAIAFLLPLMPSPALVPVFAPLLLLICAGLLLFGTQIGAKSSVVAYRTAPAKQLLALVLALVLGSIVADPSEVGLLRLLARVLFVAFVFAFATNLLRLDHTHRDRVMRAFIYGTVGVCIIAIATSVTGIAIAGELRPSRGIGLLPGGAKSAGVIRSYGEAAVIYSGGLALLYHQRHRFRLSTAMGIFAILILGISVSHSRNVYATAAFTVALIGAHFLVGRRSLLTWRTMLRGGLLIALLTPFLVGLVTEAASTNSIAAYFTGEGTLEANISSRSNHVRTAFDLIVNDPAVLATGATETEWHRALGNNVAPHNQFVSLLLFSTPLVGAIAIAILYFGPVWRGAREFSFKDGPIAIWGAGVIYALSGYEGLFSPSLALCVALMMAVGFDVRKSSPALTQ